MRGGIFDRIELLQGGSSTRFRDRNHTRLGSIAAPGAPELRDIALFVVPEDFTLEVTMPWTLQLIVQRNVGAREKAFLTFDVTYTLPEQYLKVDRKTTASADAPVAAPPAALEHVVDTVRAGELDEALWLKIWEGEHRPDRHHVDRASRAPHLSSFSRTGWCDDRCSTLG